MKSISEVTEVLQEKLVINSSKAEALHSEFDNMQLQFLYNFKINLSASPSARRYSDEIKELSLYTTTHQKRMNTLDPLFLFQINL